MALSLVPKHSQPLSVATSACPAQTRGERENCTMNFTTHSTLYTTDDMAGCYKWGHFLHIHTSIGTVDVAGVMLSPAIVTALMVHKMLNRVHNRYVMFSALLCHHEVLQQPMVTEWTTFWSFLSPWGPLAANGDSMHQLLVFSVTTRYSSKQWGQHAPLYIHFCHRKDFKQPIVKAYTSFFVIFVTTRSSSSPWWQNAPLFGHFCHREVL